VITRTKPKARPKRPARAVRSKARSRDQARPGQPLSRERIAAAAMALVDREGLAALSTRRLGSELGCEAMSIYHHFPNKAYLMDALVDLMLAQARVPAADEGEWLERLRRAAHGFRAMARTILDEHLGFRPDFIEHQLAHAVRDPNGRAYNRTAHLAERRTMMQSWADFLDNLRIGAKVHAIRHKRA